MQAWKLIGVGLLISVLVRGCPDREKQPTNLTAQQPLQTASPQGKSGLSSNPPLPLLKPPSIIYTSPLQPKDIQASSSGSVPGNRLDNLKRPQLSPSQVPVVPPVDREASSRLDQQEPEIDLDISRNQYSQVPVVPPVDREASSRLDQQEPEIGLDISHNQSNIPVDEESRNSLINQEAAQRDSVSVTELPKVETELRLAPEERSEPLPENSLNPALISGVTIPTDVERVTPQNQHLPDFVVSPSSGSGSGRCDYPWELDSAGNRCGDRAASERPNLSAGVSVGNYSPPIQSYSIPTSSYGSTYVRGYFRRDGTYVRGHSRRRR